MELNEKEQELLNEVCNWMYRYKLAIHPSTNLISKIKDIIKNNGVCVCDDTRMCPCQESLEEVRTQGSCKCRLFCDFHHGDLYLVKFEYRDYKAVSGELIKEGKL